MLRACVLGGLLLASVEPQTLAAQVSGRVNSAADGRAIMGAEVRLEGRDTIAVRTDAEGRFVLQSVAPGRYVLRARAMGYVARVRELELAARDSSLVVALAPAALALDQLVVTAARREQRLGDAVTTVEVVSRADLDRTGAADLASVLIEHTGIELQGGMPNGAGVMLQGIGSERVLVLLDGQPLAGRLSGNFDISRIPVAMIERVEVVKGAQSTLYGSEAMGGVVNIITRAAAPEMRSLAASVTGTAGMQGRLDGSTRLSAVRGAWSASGDVGRRSVRNAPGISRDDGALAARLDGALKLRWSPDSMRSAELSVLALDERQRWRTGGGFFSFNDNQQVNARLGARFRRGRHHLAPGLSLSQQDHLARTSAFTLPIAGDTGQRQLQRIAQGEVMYGGVFSPRVAVDAGVQVRVDEIEAARVPGGLRSHTSIEPFAQLDLTPSARVSIVPGVRVTQSNIWGTQVIPRLAARAAVTDRLTLRASVGDGFRAPDFKELYLFFQNTSAGYALVGNTDLRPEQSRSAMLGAEWGMPGGYVRAQGFHNAFTGFIEAAIISAPNAPLVFEYRNRDNGYTRGLELETGSNLTETGSVRGELGWSYLETRDNTTGRELLGRPMHSARATLQLPLLFASRASLTAVHTGRTPMQRDDATGLITSRRDAFTRLDVRLSRPLPSLGLEWVAGADNLFAARPDAWAGFTGRHVYTSLTYTLR
jgi:outer membrane receptor for ferrienterochelin and colicins